MEFVLYLFSNLNFGFISLIISSPSRSSCAFLLGNGALAIPFGENPKHLQEVLSDSQRDKPKVQVSNLNFRSDHHNQVLKMWIRI